MKMSNFKPKLKLVAALAAALIAIIMVAGCGGNNTATNPPAATNNTATDTPAATEDTSTAANTPAAAVDPLQPTYDASNYATPLTIDVYSDGGTFQGPMTDGWFSKLAKDMFNLSFNIIGGQSGGNAAEIYTARSAAGDLGDIISISNQHLSDCVAAGNLIYDMTDLYATNLQAYSTQFDSAEKNLQAFLNTDKVWGLPNTVSSQAPTSPNLDGTNPQYGAYMRLDEYLGVGAPAINSLDDLLNVMQQMKAKYPTSDSGKPTYGFSLFKDWDGGGGAWWPAQIPQLYGYARFNGGGSSGFYVNAVTGQIQTSLDEDGIYKQTLEMLFKANQMGLLDPDSATQDFNTLTTDKYGDGAVFFSPVSW
ncbi:MAG: hypothetical protein FWF44_06900, partial [Defluviitaleaceae bacterium]|nr:hypothetical protein [Defluviitaleaceae bacterium]